MNLYSDPPKPARSAQSGLKQGASRLVVLDFPQAQRAEIGSGSLHPDQRSSHQSTFILPTLSSLSFPGHIIKIQRVHPNVLLLSVKRSDTTSTCPPTRSPDPLPTQRAARILYSQADKFLQQVRRQLLKPSCLLDHVPPANNQRLTSECFPSSCRLLRIS